MSYNLFLDDKWNPELFDYNKRAFIVTRSYQEAITYMKKHGQPNFISFDYDLGEDSNGKKLPTGQDVLTWIVLESKFDMLKLKFAVHTENKPHKKRLAKLLEDYIGYLKSVMQRQ